MGTKRSKWSFTTFVKRLLMVRCRVCHSFDCDGFCEERDAEN